MIDTSKAGSPSANAMIEPSSSTPPGELEAVIVSGLDVDVVWTAALGVPVSVELGLMVFTIVLFVVKVEEVGFAVDVVADDL
jgi:hypothetical protein